MDPPASNGAHSTVGAAPQEHPRGPVPIDAAAAPPPPLRAPVQAPNYQPSVRIPVSQESGGRGADPSNASAVPAAGAGGAAPELNPYAGGAAPETSPAAPPSSYEGTHRSSPDGRIETMETVKNVLSRWGRKIEESARKAEDLSRNTWQHLKTGPSLTEAAMGRIAQGTKVIAEGGYENIFRQTFETLPEEQLRKSYACYLSTSAGPVMGVLYLSSAKLAFCSDNPLSYKSENKTEWSYYKVVIPLHQLRACNPSISRTNSAEKYIQIVSVDNHEFWFMGFVNYSDAVQTLQETMQHVRGSAV